MLTFIVTHVYFPPVPALLALVSLLFLLFERPKHWMIALVGFPILAFINANIFQIYFARTLSSILLAVSVTALPCLTLALFLQRQWDAYVPSREILSNAKAARLIASTMIVAAVFTIGIAYAPEYCFTAKCKLGDFLLGPRRFNIFWFACLVGASFASMAFLALKLIAVRALRE